MAAYATIYVADGAVAQALTTTPAQMTGFATEGATADDQGYADVTADVANDQIIVKAPGGYLALFNCSGELASADETVQANLRVENSSGTATEDASGQCICENETANEPLSMGFNTTFEVTQAQLAGNSGEVNCTIYLECTASANFTPTHSQFTIVKIY